VKEPGTGSGIKGPKLSLKGCNQQGNPKKPSNQKEGNPGRTQKAT